MAGPRAGSPGLIDIETIIDDGCEKRRQAADPCNFPILRCPHRNGGTGKGHARQWLTFGHCWHCGDPVFAPTSPRRSWPCSRSASCLLLQISGGSQALRATDTGTSSRPGNTSSDSLRRRRPAGFHQGRLPIAWRRQSGQTDSADRLPTYLAMLESARLQPVRLP